MATESWGDAGLIGWLVDGAAIITQTRYARVLPTVLMQEHYNVFVQKRCSMLSMVKRLSWRLAEGTEEQKEMVQDALNRWWPALLMFFGPASKATTGASKQDVTIKYKIRTKTNEELRQDFFTKYIPRIQSLGLTIPDSTIHFDEATANLDLPTT